jgi:hypothetical protein
MAHSHCSSCGGAAPCTANSALGKPIAPLRRRRRVRRDMREHSPKAKEARRKRCSARAQTLASPCCAASAGRCAPAARAAATEQQQAALCGSGHRLTGRSEPRGAEHSATRCAAGCTPSSARCAAAARRSCTASTPARRRPPATAPCGCRRKSTTHAAALRLQRAKPAHGRAGGTCAALCTRREDGACGMCQRDRTIVHTSSGTRQLQAAAHALQAACRLRTDACGCRPRCKFD